MTINIVNLIGDLAIKKGETYNKIEFYYLDDISDPIWEMSMHIRKNYTTNNTTDFNLDKLAEFSFLPNTYGFYNINGNHINATKITPFLTYTDTRNLLLPESSIKNKIIAGVNCWLYELEAFNTIEDIKLKICSGFVEVLGEITVT